MLVRHSNLAPILHCLEDIAGFCAHDPTLFHPISGALPNFPLHHAHVGISPSINQPWNYFRSIPTYAITVPKRHGRTVRQTVRRTDDTLWHNRMRSIARKKRARPGSGHWRLQTEIPPVKHKVRACTCYGATHTHESASLNNLWSGSCWVCDPPIPYRNAFYCLPTANTNGVGPAVWLVVSERNPFALPVN